MSIETTINFETQVQSKNIKFHSLLFKMIIQTAKIVIENQLMKNQATLAFMSSYINLDYSTIRCYDVDNNNDLPNGMMYQLEYPHKYEIWHGGRKICMLLSVTNGNLESYRIHNYSRFHKNSMDMT